MNRVCVIDIAGLSLTLAGRDDSLWVRSLPGALRAMRATFPAVTPSVQASMTTGVAPGLHGVVAGAIYRRQAQSVSLDERSNTLLTKKRFWHARALPARPKVGLVMWTNPLAGAADAVLGATTYGKACAGLAEMPVGLYRQAAASAGELDTRLLRGPRADWRASEWIVRAAGRLWDDCACDLLWVYLPGVNFAAQRYGLSDARTRDALRGVDALAGELSQTITAGGGRVLVVSSGGLVDVSRVCWPNVLLREAGLLQVRRGPDGEEVDFPASRAFALVDHQVAHLFCRDEATADDAAAVLREHPAVGAVLPRDELFCPGLGHDRAGERVALAATDAWFSYAWWSEPDDTPQSALRLDDGGKCGYDPCELLAGTGEGLIAPEPLRIRASRGLVSVPVEDQCVLGATCELPAGLGGVVTDVPEILRRLLFE